MKKKAAVKIGLDVSMTVLLLLLTGYQFWGDTVHEWMGAGLFFLFILHHILNFNWYNNIRKRTHTPLHILELIIDILLFAAMLILMYSGLVISKTVFAFLPIESSLAMARRFHIIGSYWGFLLMSLHIGFHWGMLFGLFRKALCFTSKKANVVCFAAGLVTAGYGAFVFVKRNLLSYLLLKSEFVFMDYAESKLLFYIDYLALMGLCIFIAHFLSKLCIQAYIKYRSRTQSR